MSTPLTANTVPQARDAYGTVEGTIGDLHFENTTAKVTLYNGAVRLNLTDSSQTSGREIYISFTNKIQPGESLPATLNDPTIVWVTTKSPPGSAADATVGQLTTGALTIDKLVLSPFEIKGNVYGDTESPVSAVNINFDLKY